MLLLLVALSMSTGACPEAVPVEVLRGALDRGGVAWLRLDEAAFRQAVDDGRSLLPCVRDPLDRPTVVAFHLQEALAAFLDDDEARLRGSLRAILATEPSWRLPAGYAPAGARLPEVLESLRAEPAPAGMPLPGDAEVLVDGRPADRLPLGRPYLLQVAEAGAGYRTSLAPGLPVPVPPPPDLPSPPTRSAGAPFLVAGAAAGIGAAGLYLLATHQARRLEAGDLSCDALDAARFRVNATVAASGVLAAAGVGSLAVGLRLRLP